LNRLTALLAAALVFAQTPDAGRKALDLLLSERYSEFISMLSPAAKEKLTPDFLRSQVGPEIKSFGTVKSIGAPVVANSMVTFPVQFSAVTVEIQLTIDPSGRISALTLRDAWKRPAYSRPDSFIERAVTIGEDPWKLGGTICAPVGKGSFPSVVLVHGPGPLDRDETVHSTRIFRDLAEGLASRGIAVLRYDKRTKVHGDRMSDMDFTLADETVDDAVRAVALMRAQPGAGRIYILGHSLGGYAIPRIAAKSGNLAGLIFLAANARPIEDVALEQNEYVVHLGANPPPEVLKRLDELRAEVAKVKRLEAGANHPPVVMGLPAGYLLDLKGYDPRAALARFTIPMLFLQGERDFQVTMKDFGMWKGAMQSHSNAVFHSYGALNHLFIAGEGKSTPVEYRSAGNVDAAVIADIAAFVK
jgi:pimeloyl-ACP methyl ester carboxylesterase